MLSLIFLTIFVVLFYNYVIKVYDHWKSKGIKFSQPIWIFGNMARIFFAREHSGILIRRLYNEFPDDRYSGIWQFLRPVLLIRDPELIKRIVIKDFDHFTDHPEIISEEMDPLFGKNLLASTGKRWRDLRTVMTPIFTSSKMKQMFFLVEEVAQNFIEHLTNEYDNKITRYEMKEEVSRFATDIIATIAFGVQVDSFKEKKNEFYLMGDDITNFTGFWKTIKLFGINIIPKFYKLFKIRFFSSKSRIFFGNLSEEILKLRDDKPIVRPDLIQALLKSRKEIHDAEETDAIEASSPDNSFLNKFKEAKVTNLTNEDILAQQLIFFFAGLESVSNFISLMIYELTVHPDIQDKLRNEIQETDKECNGKLTYEALVKMKFLDMVTTETLRKHPNFFETDRICTKAYTIEPKLPGEKAIYLEVGTELWIPTFALHYDPQYYPEPDRFDPERWSEENKDDKTGFTYFPFGQGPRNCIGSRIALLEGKSAIFHLLNNFILEPNENTQIPLGYTKTGFTLAPEKGVWITLRKIN